MSTKHPGPWQCTDDIVKDVNGESVIYFYTDDPATRAVLLHAAEMWEAVKSVATTRPGSPGGFVSTRECVRLHDKIESEIAKARRS